MLIYCVWIITTFEMYNSEYIRRAHSEGLLYFCSSPVFGCGLAESCSVSFCDVSFGGNEVNSCGLAESSSFSFGDV